MIDDSQKRALTDFFRKRIRALAKDPAIFAPNTGASVNSESYYEVCNHLS